MDCIGQIAQLEMDGLIVFTLTKVRAYSSSSNTAFGVLMNATCGVHFFEGRNQRGRIQRGHRSWTASFWLRE